MKYVHDLALVYLLLAIVLYYMLFKGEGNLPIYIGVVFVTLFSSLIDFVNVSFRAVSKFTIEAKLNVIISFVHLMVIVPVGYFTTDLGYVVISYLTVRLISFFLVLWRSKKEFKEQLFYEMDIINTARAINTISRVKYYGIDNAIVNFRSNIDALIIKYFLGYSSVGVYQSGMNIVKALERTGPIVCNVFLPKLAKVDANFKKYLKALSITVIIIPFVISMFILSLDFSLILGVEYSLLNELIPYMMVYLVFRFLSMGVGVVLTALNGQKWRVYCGAVNLIVTVICYVALISMFGLYGAVYTLIISAIFLFLSYAWTVLKFYRI